jgi:hypothetical protein
LSSENVNTYLFYNALSLLARNKFVVRIVNQIKPTGNFNFCKISISL